MDNQYRDTWPELEKRLAKAAENAMLYMANLNLPPIKTLVDAQLGKKLNPLGIDFTKLNNIITNPKPKAIYGMPPWLDLLNRDNLVFGMDPARDKDMMGIAVLGFSGVGKTSFIIDHIVRAARTASDARADFLRQVGKYQQYFHPREETEDLAKLTEKQFRAFEKMALFTHRYSNPFKIKPITWEEGKELEARWKKEFDKLPPFLKGSVALITQGQVKAMNAIPYNKFPKLKSRDED